MPSEEEHKAFHGEVGLTGCGVKGCDPDNAIWLHFQWVQENAQQWAAGIDDADLCQCGHRWIVHKHNVNKGPDERKCSSLNTVLPCECKGWRPVD